MKHLRVAVVGAGVMGKHHANIYALLPHAELVAVVDPDPARCAEAREQYAVATYPSTEALLAFERLDAVSVAAPTSLHYSITRRLLEAGVHVLVEKPVATDVPQAKALMAISRERGLVLQVGHITRFYRAVDLLRQQVRRPYLIEARRLTPHARIKDVGVILDLMIHDIDIVLGLVPGAAVSSLTVAGHILNGSPFEDVAAAQIIFDNGCIARFLASRVAPDGERTLVVAAPEQTIRLDFAREPYTEVAVYTPLPGEPGGHGQVETRTVHEDNPLKKELEHFLARIRGGEAPVGTLEDDLRALSLATELLARLEPNRTPHLV